MVSFPNQPIERPEHTHPAKRGFFRDMEQHEKDTLKGLLKQNLLRYADRFKAATRLDIEQFELDDSGGISCMKFTEYCAGILGQKIQETDPSLFGGKEIRVLGDPKAIVNQAFGESCVVLIDQLIADEVAIIEAYLKAQEIVPEDWKFLD